MLVLLSFLVYKLATVLLRPFHHFQRTYSNRFSKSKKIQFAVDEKDSHHSPIDRCDSSVDLPATIVAERRRRASSCRVLEAVPPTKSDASPTEKEIENFILSGNVVHFHGASVVPSTVDDEATVSVYFLVKNVGFLKSLAVRMSLDDWTTYDDVSGEWIDSPSSLVDVFRVELRLPLERLAVRSTARFAARLDVDGETYWDSNEAKNYTLIWECD